MICDLSHQNEYQGILYLFELDLYSFIQKVSCIDMGTQQPVHHDMNGLLYNVYS